MTFSSPFAWLRSSRTASFAALGLAGCFLNACGFSSCTEDIGCIDRLIVSFSEELPPGDYQVAVTTPDGEAQCDFRVASVASDGVFTCESELDLSISAVGIDFYTNPKSVEISLTRVETGVTVEVEQDVDYREGRSKGRDCPPVCHTAQIELDTSTLADVDGLGGSGGASD